VNVPLHRPGSAHQRATAADRAARTRSVRARRAQPNRVLRAGPATADCAGVTDGEQRSWNAGDSCCGFAGSHLAPDVPFVAAIVTDAVRRWPIDAARVYLVGYSNGGKLAYSSMCAHPTLFAAVATYGAVPLVPCNREPPQCRPCLPSAPQTRYCLSTASQVVTRRCRRCRRQWPGCGPRTVVQAWC
jgi:poly(3-hydroxybutyrate) depolymerase